jgi:hypothetical protein
MLTAGQFAPNKKAGGQAREIASKPSPRSDMWVWFGARSRAPAIRAMSHHDPVVVRQLPVIHKIIADETWLEGERRGQPVLPTDPVVRENVCRVVLRIGQQLRDSLRQSIDPSQAA